MDCKWLDGTTTTMTTTTTPAAAITTTQPIIAAIRQRIIDAPFRQQVDPSAQTPICEGCVPARHLKVAWVVEPRW